ncbi:MAG: branched-chain amino acid aminotransferase [Myxococcales bacterium]|nr:branched-chain amino acid aminotransferase [Polyangiaceae bacterium]MDW8250888.1 branched-chain amino acid aminotransferase [Myxococcales bacterium]
MRCTQEGYGARLRPMQNISSGSGSPSPVRTPAPLGFGRIFSEHMLTLQWSQGRGWHDVQIKPRAALAVDPAASALHYGQSMFEGLKAFRGADGVIRVFRMDAHLQRMHTGAARLAMPAIDLELTRASLLEHVRRDASWVPRERGQSLYIRPLLFATEGFLGVRPANTYTLLVLLSPVGAYYEKGLEALRIWVEQEHVRTTPGGLGAVKTGANYAASLLAAARAKSNGFDQVLWLDAVHRKNLEEVGTMNFFVRIGDEVVTPPLGDTILAGITRDSSLTLMRSWGVRVSERVISIEELIAASRSGALQEAFGTGTAAVIAPVGELGIGDLRLRLPAAPGEIASRLYNTITGIQYGELPDRYNWLTAICP